MMSHNNFKHSNTQSQPQTMIRVRVPLASTASPPFLAFQYIHPSIRTYVHTYVQTYIHTYIRQGTTNLGITRLGETQEWENGNETENVMGTRLKMAWE